MKETPKSKIHAFCTVDPSFIERDGDQIICRKCSREMADLDAEDGAGSTSSRGGRSKRLLCGVLSAAALSSCSTTEKDEGTLYLGYQAPSDEEIPVHGRLPIESYEGAQLPGKRPTPMLLAGKADIGHDASNYPEAKPIDGQPGKVKSPYGGHTVDVSRVPPNSLVIDPKFGAESDKFFRIKAASHDIRESRK